MTYTNALKHCTPYKRLHTVSQQESRIDILPPPGCCANYSDVFNSRIHGRGDIPYYIHSSCKRTKQGRKQALFPIGDINKLTYYFRLPTVSVSDYFCKKAAQLLTLLGVKVFCVWCVSLTLLLRNALALSVQSVTVRYAILPLLRCVISACI